MWKENGWMRKGKGKKEPVKNADLLPRLDKLALAKQPSWQEPTEHSANLATTGRYVARSGGPHYRI